MKLLYKEFFWFLLKKNLPEDFEEMNINYNNVCALTFRRKFA